LRIPSSAHFASEYRYKKNLQTQNCLSIFISQSGETADTLAALRYAKENKNIIVSLVNNKESSIARESDFVLTIAAGPEIGVASTKAFTAQLSILSCLCLLIGSKTKSIEDNLEKKIIASLIEIPSNMSNVLNLTEKIKKLCKHIYKAKSVLYLGRGSCFPIAMEGALKLKEISYIHAEGYASGEMKHGPIALVDKNLPIVFIAPKNKLFEKNISNMKEVLARGGKVILITDADGQKAVDDKNVKKIIIPVVDEFVQPILITLPIQLLAYYTAVLKGTDVDRPRNLAKSVTVE
jgi:glucosamine--fructose-6-phosphate aminotransferase (isomerizing)